MADIGPAAFVRGFTSRCDILDVNGADTVTELFDPSIGIGTAANDPGDIRFPGDAGGAPSKMRSIGSEPSESFTNSKS